ncbi:MAG: hypothetical protein OEU36_03810 [Gammaproteobacteria bacterium]|nr:hypothetical protein [Gammaproteobacteria bacterium]
MNITLVVIINIILFLIIWFLCAGSSRRHSRFGHQGVDTGSTVHTQATGQRVGAATSSSDAQYTQRPPDDLTVIKGIGKVIEKRLHALGVTTFEQVANFTPADIERVNQVLDFAGRIEREKWVEQARELTR